MNRLNEIELFNRIKTGDKKAFEAVFKRYYQSLCLYATKILKNDSAAEEIVQDLFVKLWEKHRMINIQSSLKNYLLRSVKNQCLNYFKHNQIKERYIGEVKAETENFQLDEQNFTEPGLLQEIEKSINALPEKRRNIFLLSREEGLKYREIAEKLGISIKTVETQMGLAIKTLRVNLKNFSTFFILFFTFPKK